jgi:YegS/Rv2252/BmrU family lipid kinase
MVPQKKNILFIINPISGIRRKRKLESAINKHLDHSKFTHQILYSQYAHHAIELSKEASHNGIDVVVAVGGDGSVNDVACGLVNSDTILGLIPVGSGNGLAHHLKIPMSYKKSIKIINRQNISRIDTATLNDKLFVSIAGVGFDALVAHEFAKCKKRGFFSYLLIILKKFPLYKPWDYTINFDGKTLSCKALLVSFANSDQFGFNASIAPVAKINDGYLDLCILRPVPLYKAGYMANKLFLKNIHRSKYVETFKIKEANIEASGMAYSHIDGDAGNLINSIKVKILPKSLNIIVPK